LCAPAIKTDGFGLLPESLEAALSAFDSQTHLNAEGVRKPRVLYTIPTGQNPNGSTLPLERKKKAKQHFLNFSCYPFVAIIITTLRI
jgi:DNA-binding transcriptional MocR family regulator